MWLSLAIGGHAVGSAHANKAARSAFAIFLLAIVSLMMLPFCFILYNSQDVFANNVSFTPFA